MYTNTDTTNHYINIEKLITMDTNDTPTDTNGEVIRNYTDKWGVRIRESYIPKTKPSYRKWVRDMGINELAYQLNPMGRDRAQSITESMGIPHEPTVWEHITGKDVWERDEPKS
jgi:hypothetical protein